MGLTQSICFIGDKLVVGQVDYSYIPGSFLTIPGSSILNGPVWIGAGVPVPTANCMIGPGLNPISLEVKGVSNFLGPITNIAGNLNVTAISNFTGAVNISAVETKNGVDLKNATNIGNAVSIDNANSVINGSLQVSGIINCPWLTGQLASIRSLAGKGFDIPHPTKEKHRLRYICLEGPEVGAYIRGTLNGSDTIELPEYWKELCNLETITVNLTPIEYYQDLYVEKNIQWGTKIKVKNNSGTPIHCHYTVFAERVTHDKLQVEYEGLTPYDYPGDNSEYALGGWDYARHKGEYKSSGL